MPTTPTLIFIISVRGAEKRPGKESSITPVKYTGLPPLVPAAGKLRGAVGCSRGVDNPSTGTTVQSIAG
jgi:hypothetical protein